MIRQLNWTGVLFGAGAGLVFGLGLFLVTGAVDRGTIVQIAIQSGSFLVAGFVAGRLSVTGEVAAGGFAGLFLYFGLAVVSVVAGSDLNPVAVLFSLTVALILGSAGGALVVGWRRFRGSTTRPEE